MASDDKKIKTSPPSKNEAAPKNKSTSDVDLSKNEDGEPSGYSRGEGQKPVSKAYKDNWNVIFAKKKSDSPTSGPVAKFTNRTHHQGEAFLARIEQLIDQALFDPDGPTQKMRDEHFGKRRLR